MAPCTGSTARAIAQKIERRDTDDLSALGAATLELGHPTVLTFQKRAPVSQPKNILQRPAAFPHLGFGD